MSTRVASQKTVSSATVGKNVPEMNFKATKQKKDLKQCLKLLDTGELKVGDIDKFLDEFNLQPQLGDHIQFELHKYCKKDIGETNTDLVVRLAELCYSDASVLHFTNIDRFVGCVFFISSHLLKKEKFKPAIAVVSSLVKKEKEILECSGRKADIRSFIYNLHSSFMASAVALAMKIKSPQDEGYEICHSLMMESLNVFKLTTIEQPNAGKKVLKTTALYLQTLKYYKEENIVEFLDKVGEIFKILLPQMGNVDYFMFYLSKLNQINRPDSDGDVQNVLRNTVDLLKVFLKSSERVKCIFLKMLDFFWINPQEEMWISDEEFEVLTGNPIEGDLNCLLASIICNSGMQFLWKIFEKSWNKNMSVGIVQKLSNTMLALHKSLSGSRHIYCPSTKVPFEVCYGDLLTGNLHKIQYTVRLCLKNKLPNALSLVPVSREAFRISMESLERMKFGCCEKQRIFSWKFSVIHHTNTVEDICRNLPSEESWFYLKECSCDVLKEIVNSDIELPFDFPRVKILFQRWHTGNLKLQNYQEALCACVIYYVFFPKEEKDIMSMWLQTKLESSNEIFQELTMAEMFKTCEQNLRDFSKTYNSSRVCLKSALLMELKAYSTCLPDTFQNPNESYNLAARIWKQLEKMKLDLWESSLAMTCLISASLIGENERLPNGFQEKCLKVIDAFMNQARKEKAQCRSLLHAANLTFSLFLYNVKTSERSEGKMDATQMVLGYLKKEEEEKVKFGEDVDLNLTCDVIPSSRHLTVELETNYFEELNGIVELWTEALSCGDKDTPLTSELDLWMRNVKQVANMYEMFGEYQKVVTTWLLYYRIGKLCNDSGASLLGLSHLIRNCSDVDASGLKREAELISGELDSEMAEKHILVEYLLAMASNYLKNKKSEKCLEHLSRARKLLEGLPTVMKSYTLNAKFWCLVSQFLVVYKEYEAVFDYLPGTDVRCVAFKAFSYANGGGRSELIKTATQSECTEHVLAMLEVSLWAYHLHGVYRQSDFMRFFLDDLYQIVQRLFLPTRTAEMLARLAEVDMICEKGSDCQEKVNKLKSILTTLSPTTSETTNIEKSTSPYLKVPQNTEYDSTTRSISPVRFVNKCSQQKDIDLSPVQFYLKDTKTSTTKEHAMKCKCRLCQNLLIQTLTMNTACLEAEIHNLKNSTKQAASCYGQACEVLNKLELVRAEQSKILRLELMSALKEDPGELDLKLAFVQFHTASFLIRFALFESSNLKSVTGNVLKTIRRIDKLMKRFSYEEKLLQWSFAELKLFCVVLKNGNVKTPRKKTPVSFTATTIQRTPVAEAGRTPVTSMMKDARKLEKSPRPCSDGVSSDGVKNSRDDVMNSAFVGIDNTETKKKQIRPRKLNFQTNDPEPKAATKTSKKTEKERPSVIPSRKLNFDTSGDIFEETPTVLTRTVTKPRRTTKTATTGKKDSVKIYTDVKDEEDKRQKGAMKCDGKKTKTKTTRKT